MTLKALQNARQEIESLKQQLAAQEVVNMKLREVLVELACLGNGVRFGNSIGNQIAIKALEISSDSTALNELIIKAGEVMRERCIKRGSEINPIYGTGAAIDAIRDLPGVTLEDLK